MRQPTLLESIKLKRHDARLVGLDQRDGWSGELPFYEWKCKIHGLVQNYEQGFYYILECPFCQKIRLDEGFPKQATQTL
jgi:hypothetical protein